MMDENLIQMNALYLATLIGEKKLGHIENKERSQLENLIAQKIISSGISIPNMAEENLVEYVIKRIEIAF